MYLVLVPSHYLSLFGPLQFLAATETELRGAYIPHPSKTVKMSNDLQWLLLRVRCSPLPCAMLCVLNVDDLCRKTAPSS